MIRYTTIKNECECETVIEKSRFIAHTKHVKSREEADAFIAEIRGRYKDASHNVPAFVIGEKQELIWASDDGEPSGTSGAPIAQMIYKEGLTNLCIVVTRYFGGIKLGTGGLVRAYTGIAKAVIDKGGRHDVRDMVEIRFRFPYQQLNRLQLEAEKSGFEIKRIEYLDELIVTIILADELECGIISMLSNLISKDLEIIEKIKFVY